MKDLPPLWSEVMLYFSSAAVPCAPPAHAHTATFVFVVFWGTTAVAVYNYGSTAFGAPSPLFHFSGAHRVLGRAVRARFAGTVNYFVAAVFLIRH